MGVGNQCFSKLLKESFSKGVCVQRFERGELSSHVTVPKAREPQMQSHFSRVFPGNLRNVHEDYR